MVYGDRMPVALLQVLH